MLFFKTNEDGGIQKRSIYIFLKYVYRISNRKVRKLYARRKLLTD